LDKAGGVMMRVAGGKSGGGTLISKHAFLKSRPKKKRSRSE